MKPGHDQEGGDGAHRGVEHQRLHDQVEHDVSSGKFDLRKHIGGHRRQNQVSEGSGHRNQYGVENISGKRHPRGVHQPEQI